MAWVWLVLLLTQACIGYATGHISFNGANDNELTLDDFRTCTSNLASSIAILKTGGDENSTMVDPFQFIYNRTVLTNVYNMGKGLFTKHYCDTVGKYLHNVTHNETRDGHLDRR